MTRFLVPPSMGDGTHRSGWPYVISLLSELDIPILFDDVIEWHFSNVKSEPWTGFFHLPPNIGPDNKSLSWQQIFKDPQLWLHSEHLLKMVFVMSNHLKNMISPYLSVPIHVVYHPVETPELKFDEKDYKDNDNKYLHQLGWTFRNILGIWQVPPFKFTRSWVEPITAGGKRNLELSLQSNNRTIYDGVISLNYMNNNKYDYFLSRNVMFMETVDSSANNGVIDCIIRNTPLIINKNPAIVEYLGPEYPLYFSNVEEVPELAERALEGHHYLVEMDKTFLSEEFFKQEMLKYF